MAASPTHDLIVIGAGPAGATAARVAAGLGARVALIDKAAFPREKLCGGALTTRASRYLAASHGPLPTGLLHPCKAVRFADGPRLLAEERGALPLTLTMRRALDAHLWRGALASGAEDWTGRRIAALDPASGIVRLEDGAWLQGAAVIGADGVHSMVARVLLGDAAPLRRVGFALEAEVDGPPGEVMELDLTAVPYGYGWDFPKAHGRTLGLGGVQALSGDMMGRFRAWLAARGVDPAGVRIKGHHLPFGQMRTRIGEGRVVLAGDAAGLVDPVTGEGIAWAVLSGQRAAQAALAALAQGQPDRTHALYGAAMRDVLGEVRRAGRIARLAHHPFWQPRVLAAIAGSGHLRRRYLQLLAGEMDHADIGLSRMVRLMLRLTLGRGAGGLG